jgi:hypothetical protein
MEVNFRDAWPLPGSYRIRPVGFTALKDPDRWHIGESDMVRAGPA